MPGFFDQNSLQNTFSRPKFLQQTALGIAVLPWELATTRGNTPCKKEHLPDFDIPLKCF